MTDLAKEMIEAAARAACADKLWPNAFEQECEANQDAWRREARAALIAALEKWQSIPLCGVVNLAIHDVLDELKDAQKGPTREET